MNYDQKKGQEFDSWIGNLTLDHKSPLKRGQMIFDWDMLHIVGKIFFKAIKYCSQMIKKDFFLGRYEHPKFRG
jgi:hypothetical protein